MVVYKILDTELGRVMLGAVGGKLAFCHFVLPALEAVLERVAADFPGALIVPVGEHTEADMCPEGVFRCFAREFSLEDLLCGRGSIFRWEDMYVRGTPLQVAVWREMFSLGPGELITYSQLALRCGYPKAVRAVASAVGKNPFSLIVPCHRVLRSEAFNADGEINANKLGNYYWGKDLKRRILQKEGLIWKNGRSNVKAGK
ncbi:MAG: methylated-DNA--[Bacteroidales bacterium]|nr:methylated-DNA--[protein]-cysteine S-methyltransferase [Bacteroidales bacterium]